MAGPSLVHTLSELRRVVRGARRRSSRFADVAPLISRLLQGAHTVGIEPRSGGMAFRLEAHEPSGARCLLTCVVQDAAEDPRLTPSEHEVAGLLCDGRTLAQIARLRGVTINTVKSQVRQIFRKLDVDSRVALVRRLCP